MGEAAEKRNVVLGPGRLKVGEHARISWDVVVPVEVEIADLEDKNFWSLHAERFTDSVDEVRVIRDDMAWVAYCIVLRHSRNWAQLKVLHFYELGDVEPRKESDTYSIEWKGPHNKWCVLRKSDGDVVKKQLQTREDAHTWMTEHEKVV